ncbi:hypothetical protein NL676_036895 [Syzygium grande]|nr:hypothetical protein NL676_036895 [Syzygium grande]
MRVIVIGFQARGAAWPHKAAATVPTAGAAAGQPRLSSCPLPREPGRRESAHSPPRLAAAPKKVRSRRHLAADCRLSSPPPPPLVPPLSSLSSHHRLSSLFSAKRVAAPLQESAASAATADRCAPRVGSQRNKNAEASPFLFY